MHDQRSPSTRRQIPFLLLVISGSILGVLSTACGEQRAGCDAIIEPGPRVECRYQHLQSFTQNTGKLELELAKIEAPTEHDLVALRLMVQNPSLFPLVCPRMKTPSARERCARLEERPHLSERARRPDVGAPK